MIKSNKGNVIMKGNIVLLAAEFASVVKALKEIQLDHGKTEKEAKELLDYAYSLAFYSDEQLKQRAEERVTEILEETAEHLRKELGEGEDHE